MDRTEEKNSDAWNSGAYEAWIRRFGTPAEAARKLIAQPVKRIGELYPYFEEISGKKIINLLGSNGMKAVALSVLGAEVTVVDFSEENEKYALELAAEAGKSIRYVVSDVLKLPSQELSGDYDTVLMEKGILHYFNDLEPLFIVVRDLLKEGGHLILQDFHPVSTKLISSKGTTANIRKHKVTGNYFNSELVEREVAFTKFTESGDVTNKVYLRLWTLGEIVTAAARSGLRILELTELPNLSSEVYDSGIPKSFILVAAK